MFTRQLYKQATVSTFFGHTLKLGVSVCTVKDRNWFALGHEIMWTGSVPQPAGLQLRTGLPKPVEPRETSHDPEFERSAEEGQAVGVAAMFVSGGKSACSKAGTIASAIPSRSEARNKEFMPWPSTEGCVPRNRSVNCSTEGVGGPVRRHLEV